jgi:polar amino acid transport system substrate-binding protein
MILKRSIAFIFWLFASSVYAQNAHDPMEDDNTVVLGVVEFPPLVIKDDEGFSCHGDAVTISRTILELAGYKVEVECPPPARLFERVRKGDIDLTVNVKGTKALDNNVTFVEKPFSYLSIVLMTNSGLSGQKTVAAIRGYDYVGLRQELVDDGYTFFDMPNSTDAIQLFQFGRTTHLATYEAPYLYHIERVPDNISDVAVSMRRDIPTFFAISNNSARKDELLKKLTHLFSLSSSRTVIEQMKTRND